MEIRKILLVDDTPEIRTIGRLSLQQKGGWEVVLAASGEEALVRAVEERPDLIILDVIMPRMDGPTTLQRLRAVGVEAPILFLTALVHEHELAKLRALGAVGVITKPFRPSSLPDEIRAILA